MLTKTMMMAAAVTLAIGVAATAAHAYQPVTDRETFVQLVTNKNLSNRLYGVNLSVSPEGTITGTGAGWDVTGTWTWQDGFFCRELTWGGDPLPYNCQLVEAHGDEVRFTTDQGAGRSASFRLR